MDRLYRMLGPKPFSFITLSALILFACAVIVPSAEAADEEPAAVANNVLIECVRDVTYSWEFEVLEPSTEQLVPGQPPLPDKVVTKRAEVFYKNIVASDKEETKAQAALAAIENEHKAAALENCRTEHENESRCMSAKLHASSREYRQLDFESRRALREAVVEDCRNKTGRCLSARLGKASCREVILAASPDEKAKQEEDDSSNKKQKKKTKSKKKK